MLHPHPQSNPTKKLKLPAQPVDGTGDADTGNWRVGRHANSWMLKPRHHLHCQPLFFFFFFFVLPFFHLPSFLLSLIPFGLLANPTPLPCYPASHLRVFPFPKRSLSLPSGEAEPRTLHPRDSQVYRPGSRVRPSIADVLCFDQMLRLSLWV